MHTFREPADRDSMSVTLEFRLVSRARGNTIGQVFRLYAQGVPPVSGSGNEERLRLYEKVFGEAMRTLRKQVETGKSWVIADGWQEIPLENGNWELE